MKKHGLWIVLLVLVLLATGCQTETVQPQGSSPNSLVVPNATRPEDIEPTVEYGWTDGESPVPELRIGYVRAGLNYVDHAVSPTGIYFIQKKSDFSSDSYIIYADNGSDTFIKLCGRPDCSHAGPDCNAYVYEGSNLCYQNGYLYVVSGGDQLGENSCRLIRMDPDGTNRVTMLDMTAYVKERGADSAECDIISDGMCLFSGYKWETTPGDEPGSFGTVPKHTGYYCYKLDGSMDKPEDGHPGGLACYNCGEVFLSYLPVSVNGGEYGSYYEWDTETNTYTFLTDHPGQPGWFGREQGFYYKDGAICRLTYATQTEEIMVKTGLEGDYYASFLPDCIVVGAYDKSIADSNLYIYDWSFNLLETVEITRGTSRLINTVIAETAERLILTSGDAGIPTYYINKADFGTGSVKIHEFNFA